MTVPLIINKEQDTLFWPAFSSHYIQFWRALGFRQATVFIAKSLGSVPFNFQCFRERKHGSRATVDYNLVVVEEHNILRLTLHLLTKILVLLSSKVSAMMQRLSLLSILLSVAALSHVNAETVQLASCPQEPDVIGKFYNNGETCVRDRVALSRDIQTVNCPDDFKFQAGWCRKRLHRKVKPKCPKDWQMFLGTKGECHSPCPTNYSKSYGQCTLRRASLSPKFMTCPALDADGNEQHRYGAYCCSQELGHCPRPECKVGSGVPGKFYYEDGKCIRQAESIPRVTMPKLAPRLDSSSKTHGPAVCPAGKIPFRNVCQEACPPGFNTLKGKCELRSCIFDTKKDLVLQCPEGSYSIPQAIL